MILNAKFNIESFSNWIEEFLPDYSRDVRKVEIPSGFSDAKLITTLGESNLGVRVFVIETIKDPSGRKVGLAKDSFNLIKNYGTPNALIAYYSESSENWRFSLLTSTPSWNEGKIITKLSNPKRHSYVLGPNAKVNTPSKFLINKSKILDFNDLKSRFSLEVVNKEFYKEISESFTKLVGGTRGERRNKKTYESVLKLPSINDHSLPSIEFAVRLIGRVIFCWFLREKISESGSSLMPKELLSLDAISNNNDYYHKILEPIFFEVLNKPIKSRKDSYDTESFSQIPYLNGGLFSPHEDDFFSYNEGKQAQFHNTVIVPDDWFREFFSILETYNFTIDENTSIDEDLSIDPEMLGRIFENLLAEINPETGESARKSTGSYYTPRVIVDYMVDESLLLYLKQKTTIDEEKIRAIISYDLSDDSSYPLNESEKEELIDAIEKVKILDPACGSGAFPIGALQKIVFILQQTDPEGQIWFHKQIQNTSPEIRRVMEREFTHKNFDYIRKLGIIRENIYGIDIQPIATEISRLRCFLTLVVDERIDDTQENRGIEPLPNLDFKFVTANSLIGIPKPERSGQINMFDNFEKISELKSIRDQYFTSSGIEREQLKSEFHRVQKNLVFELVQEHGFMSLFKAELTQKLTEWDPFTHKASSWFDPEWMFGLDKFDIVIANPPYVGEKGHKAVFENLKTTSLGRRFYKGKMDLFYFFFHLGIDILQMNGVLTFISTNYYLTATNADKLRADYKARATLLRFINFHELKIFESAIGQHNLITQLQKGKRDIDCQTAITAKKGYPGDTSSAIPQILTGVDEDTEYYRISQTNIYNSRGFIDIKNNPLSELMENITLKHPRLKNYYKVSKGLETGNNAVFVFDGHPDFYEKLSESERQYIKPFFKNSDVKKYITDAHATKSVLYIDKDFMPGDNPHILQYLETYHDDLANRAQIIRSKQAWYTLLWPRDVRMFTGDKIVFPYRAKTNIFSLVKGEWFSGTDTYFVYDSSRRSLELCLALLNSKLALVWLKNKGAVKGEILELKGDVVADFPVPKPTPNTNALESQIITAISQAIHVGRVPEGLETQLNMMIYELYGLTPEEIRIVESGRN